jgi:pimeloyl-ACP methyl ester carboxylesterase
MRTKFLTIALFLLSSFGAKSQSISDFIGSWEGKIKFGVEVRAVFNIKANENNNGLISTTDSPDQGVYGFKCDTTIVWGDSIRIEIRGFNAVYVAKLTTDSTLSGILTQGLPIILELTKKSGPVKERFPQTPKPPFPYKSEDVEYDNADKSIHYGATITIPQGKGPFPAAVLITGSGFQDRDETIMGHKSFAVLADALTRNGIAVLRVDDRGRGKSTGDVTYPTSADFAKDVNTSLNYLLTRPEVNKKKLGLIGHSEGGMIAPMVANQRNDIDFIVLLAGPGVKITELMVEQNEKILASSGISPEAIKEYIKHYKVLMDEVILASREINIEDYSRDSLMLSMNLRDASRDWADTTSPSIQKEFYKSEKQRQQQVDMLINMVTSNWFRYFIKYDPQPALEKLRCKVLAINGSKDIQVISTSNLAGIEKSLKKSKSKTYSVKELPGLNHLFQTCVNCSLMEYGELEETFSPVALKEINDWLNKYVK